jgi:SNF2 family DNA or RNA helicase
MFALTAPGLLGNAQQFRDKIQRPIEKGAVDTSAQFSTLRRRIAPFLLRRTKELVASELPAKQEQIIQVELAPAHRRLYDRQLQRERQRVLHLAEDIEHNQVEVLSALTRLRQMSIDPALVDTEASAPSSKLDVLLPLLEEATQEGHCTLVFSQFTTYLRMIAARLDAAGVKYSYLDGSTTNRRKVIDGFANGDDPVFLISLKAGGVGLNLTMADYVIICDPWWNPAVEAQAVDRTHRIGQTRSVHVYRLVSQDTIEEKVLALQDAKRQLVAEVLLGDDPAASQPTASVGSGSAQEVEGSGVAADAADAKRAGVSAGTGVARKPRAVGGSRLSAEDLHMLLS